MTTKRTKEGRHAALVDFNYMFSCQCSYIEMVKIKPSSLYSTRTRTPLCWGLALGYTQNMITIALPIPTCWYLKSLADPTRAPADPTRASGIWLCWSPSLLLIQRSPVQFRAWSHTGIFDYNEAGFMHPTPRVVHNFPKVVDGHVNFILFVYFFPLELSSQLELGFWWNIGF